MRWKQKLRKCRKGIDDRHEEKKIKHNATAKHKVYIKRSLFSNVWIIGCLPSQVQQSKLQINCTWTSVSYRWCSTREIPSSSHLTHSLPQLHSWFPESQISARHHYWRDRVLHILPGPRSPLLIFYCQRLRPQQQWRLPLGDAEQFCDFGNSFWIGGYQTVPLPLHDECWILMLLLPSFNCDRALLGRLLVRERNQSRPQDHCAGRCLDHFCMRQEFEKGKGDSQSR